MVYAIRHTSASQREERNIFHAFEAVFETFHLVLSAKGGIIRDMTLPSFMSLQKDGRESRCKVQRKRERMCSKLYSFIKRFEKSRDLKVQLVTKRQPSLQKREKRIREVL